MSELKKCPFCGGEAQVNTWTMHGITESRCFCSNSDCPNSVRTVALEQWNTRPIEDALNARIAELEHDLANKEIEYTDLWDDALAFQSRIAELSQAVGLITTLKPTMVMDANHPLDMVREVAEHVTARNEALRIRLVANDELPEAKESVLALVKSKWSGELYIERACYIPPKSIRADDFFLDDLEDESVEEYDEELDLYWVAEGWWEDSHEANVNWKITGEVIGWWSLPKIEELEAETEVQE